MDLSAIAVLVVFVLLLILAAWRPDKPAARRRPAAAEPIDCGYCDASLELLNARELAEHVKACATRGRVVSVRTQTNAAAASSEHAERHEESFIESTYRCERGGPRPPRRDPPRLSPAIAFIFILPLLGCETIDDRATAPPSISTRTAAAPIDWRARAIAIVEAKWPDTDAIRGAIAVEYCRIMNPIGECAAMTADERHAAVVALADGWEEGVRQLQDRK